MEQDIFESFVKEKLPRPDDRKFFEELYEIYKNEGKDAVSKHLKELISKLEE